MSSSHRSQPQKLEPVAPGAKVTWIELFYDLVFVYAFIRVTLTASVGLASLLRVVLLLAMLWILWINFTILGNLLRADEGSLRLASIVGAAATFIAARVIPFAFNQERSIQSADVVFIACFLLVRGVQLFVLRRADRYRRMPPRWYPMLVPPLVSTGLLVAAACAPLFAAASYVFATQIALLGLAVAVAYGPSLFRSFSELEWISPRHWADRYAQIILIALGETIISLGTARVPERALPSTWPLVGASAFVVTTIAAMAFAYFDVRFLAGELALRESRGRAQADLARDAYVLLHLPMIIGILLFALGLQGMLPFGHQQRSVTDPAGLLPAGLLYGGLFTYLMALMAFQRRVRQPIYSVEVVGRPLLLALIPAAALLPAIAALALLAVHSVVTTVLKYVMLAAQRNAIRHEARQRERAVEVAEVHTRRQEEGGSGD